MLEISLHNFCARDVAGHQLCCAVVNPGLLAVTGCYGQVIASRGGTGAMLSLQQTLRFCYYFLVFSDPKSLLLWQLMR